MSDQGQWFKLWIGADDDPDLCELSLDDFARWCKLGLYVKKHGTDGTVSITKPASLLAHKFRVSSLEDVVSCLHKLPNLVTVSHETNLVVTFTNWHKYQGDYSTHRVRKFRRNETPKKRGEEKRGEERRRDIKSLRQAPPPVVDKSQNPSKNGEYKITTPVQYVVVGYKMSKGVEPEDRAWDKALFSRSSKAAKALLELFGKNMEGAKKAVDCIDGVAEWLEKSNLSWTIETVVTHAVDFKNKQGAFSPRRS